MRKEIMRGFFSGPYITLSKISEFLEKNKDSIESLGINLPEIDTSDEYLMKAIKGPLKEKLNLRNIHSSTNEVFIPLDDYGTIISSLIVRGGSRKKIEKQFLMEKFIYDKISEEGVLSPLSGYFPFSKPLGLIEIDDKYFYILRRVLAENLANKFASSVISKVISKEIKKALKNFASFHGVLAKQFEKKSGQDYRISYDVGGRTISYNIKKFDYLENIVERAVTGKKPRLTKSLVEFINKKNENLEGIEEYERLGYNKYLFPFLKEYKSFVKKNLSDILFETGLHGDAYSTNVLETGIIIDPKPLKKGNPILDISHFLISPEFRKVVARSSHRFLDYYLKYLLKQQNAYFSNPYTNRKIKKIKETYNPHIIHNSICLVGAMLNQNKIEDAMYFLKLAEDTMEQSGNHRLKKSFDNYIKNSKYAKHKGLFNIRVGVDFDGVISDATKLKIETAKRDYGVELQPKDCSENNAEHVGMPRENYKQIIQKIYSTPYFLDAEKLPGVKDVMDRLIKRGDEVYIVTSRTDEEAAIAKNWLDKNGIRYTKLINLNYQSKLQTCREYNLDVFVDDTPKKLLDLTGQGLELYLFSTPANENASVESNEVKRLKSWEDFGAIYNLS